MTISSSASGFRPGVCVSTNLPADPYIGQAIYESDTGLFKIWGGSQWNSFNFYIICTSSTRPTTSLSEGDLIYETDTDRLAVWNGSSWIYKSQAESSDDEASFVPAYGEFILRPGFVGTAPTIASSGVTKVPLIEAPRSKNMTLNTSTYEWTHAKTGVYKLQLQYRQNSGGDVWIQYAVRKVATNTVVGTSARCGAVNSSQMAVWEMFYNVDSTTDSYALYGWAAGTIAVFNDAAWSSSPFSGTAGHSIKVNVLRVE